MEFLRMKFEQVRQLLGGLNTSQKLVGWLAAILVAVSLVWMLQAAGAPEMVNVFNTPPAAESQMAAEQALRQSGLTVKTIDGDLKVSAAEKNRAWAILAAQQILPPDAMSDLMESALNPSLWQTESNSARLWTHAKQTKLSSMITAGFADVKQAYVVVQKGRPKSLGTARIKPNASVSLTMNPGRITTRRMRKAIADMVQPVVPGLARENISIVDTTNKKSFKVPNDDEDTGERLDSIAGWDKYYADKIRQALSNIPGVIVSVSTVLDPTRSLTTEARKYSTPVTAKAESSSEEMRGSGGTAAEPGVAANGSARLPTSVGGGGSSERTQTAMEVRFPEERTVRTEGPGGLKELTASVRVPRTFLVHAYQSQNGSDNQPGPADIDAHLMRIRDCVKTAANIKDDRNVEVDWYVAPPAETVVAEAQASVVGALTTNPKPIVLGTLAVAALVMVMMFAKRKHADPPIMQSSLADTMLDTTVGAVDGGEGALEGIELDEDSIRTQKVVEQVGDMVRERPDSATSLVKRWIEQG